MTAVVPVDLQRATDNAALFSATLAESRGHELVHGDGFLAVNGPHLLRVLVLAPGADVRPLVRDAGREVLVEDPHNTVDLADLGFARRQTPMMIRRPGPLPAPSLEVALVRTVDELAVAERVVIGGFPLPGYPAGELFTPALLDHPAAEVFLVSREGEIAGACLSIADDTAGVYWVTTLEQHRSRGVGRQLMHAVLNRLDRTVVLSATEQGKPLYDSLGFTTVTHAARWSN